MTKLAEKKIINELSGLKEEIKEIKQFFYYLVDEDFWIYEPKMKNYLKDRFREAEKEFKENKAQPIGKLWKQAV